MELRDSPPRRGDRGERRSAAEPQSTVSRKDAKKDAESARESWPEERKLAGLLRERGLTLRVPLCFSPRLGGEFPLIKREVIS